VPHGGRRDFGHGNYAASYMPLPVPRPIADDGCRIVGDAAWREPPRCVQSRARAGMVQEKAGRRA